MTSKMKFRRAQHFKIILAMINQKHAARRVDRGFFICGER